MKIYLASDHGGYELKEKLKSILADLNYDIEDFGPHKLISEDDYPDYVAPAMTAMQNNLASKAIVICRNGVGVSVLANKFNGIRAGLALSKEHVVTARNDDDINVLALPADFLSFEKTLEIVGAFLNTKFSNADKHKRRLTKIAHLELSQRE